MVLRKLIGILQLVFAIMCNVFFPPVHFIWILLLQPLKLFSPSFYDRCESILLSWAIKIVPSWIWLGHVIVEEAGDNLVECYNDKSLVMCNHQSTSDVPLLMYYLSTKPNVLKRVSWVMDILFKYTHFGLMCQFHRDYFIKQGKETRSDELIKFKDFLLGSYSNLNRKWMILFPEGGFLYKRIDNSQSYASKHGFVHLNYTTLPRYGALDIALNTLASSATSPRSEKRLDANDKSIAQQRQSIKWIIDLTICYPNGNAVSFAELVSGRTFFSQPLKILFLTRKYPISDVRGKSETDLRNWLYNRWAEKDEMLKKYYETGHAFLPEKTFVRAISSDTSIEYRTPSPTTKVASITTDSSPKALSRYSSKSDVKTDNITLAATSARLYELPEMRRRIPQPLKLDFLQIFAVYCFFILSCFLHYRALYYVAGYVTVYLRRLVFS